MSTTAAEQEVAFPTLTPDEMEFIRSHATRQTYSDGELVFKAGQADIDFFVVESGLVEILNPTADDAHVVDHPPGEFCGDIDLITRRPVIVNAVARGPRTVCLRVRGAEFRRVLHSIPKLGEKLLTAFAQRRKLLTESGTLGVKIIGPAVCAETNLLREFLYKNFVPHTWYDPATADGKRALEKAKVDGKQFPVAACPDGSVHVNPTLRKLSGCIGLLKNCPTGTFDLAIIGGGPAGMAAAVYAASEALSTIVLDRLGPGGQASGSSMIENFIGFPSGLSGAELGSRGTLQMFKFGATFLTPVMATRLVPGDAYHTLHTDADEKIRAKVVLIATGVKWRRLVAKDADRFDMAGIYYAATTVEQRLCDGSPVIVVGGGNSAGQAAMFLSESSPRVHLLIRGDNFAKSMSDYLARRIKENPRITVHLNSEIESVLGEGRRLSGVEVIDKSTEARKKIDCCAVFVFIGAEPYTAWLPDSIARDSQGYLLTGAEAKASGKWPLSNREPCPLETSLPRVLAGGDVRLGSTKRVGFAVGDGSLAVTCVHRLRTT
jgi:thioredoxin reductase (NADPH)